MSIVTSVTATDWQKHYIYYTKIDSDDNVFFLPRAAFFPKDQPVFRYIEELHCSLPRDTKNHQQPSMLRFCHTDNCVSTVQFCITTVAIY